jgi:mono/diheme cytochrome c family protein
MNARWRVSVALGLVALVGCGSARRGVPFDEPLVLDAQQREGQRAFMRHCNQCHPEGGGGLGPALNNKPLPGPAIRLQIRKGVGEMPSFDEQRLPDAQLEALSAYLLELQTPRRR